MNFERIVDSGGFHARWRSRPVLVVTGADDRRIPVGYVRQRVERLKAGGVRVTSVVYPGEDHFLFFSQLDAVLGDVSDWLAQIDRR